MRHGSKEEQDSDDVVDNQDGHMAGLDDAEMMIDCAGVAPDLATKQENALRSLLGDLRGGAKIASVGQSTTPFSDYDPAFLLLTHPTAFPYGCGACPKKMSLQYYHQLLLRRFPSKQYAENVTMCLEMFNVQLRHDTNRFTTMRARGDEGLFKELDKLAESDMYIALEALAKGKQCLLFNNKSCMENLWSRCNWIATLAM